MKLTNPNLWTIVLFLIGTALQLGGFQSKEMAYLCFFVAAMLLLYSSFVTASVPGGFVSKWTASWALRFGGTVSLRDAARVAYEAARKNNTFWAHAAERLGTDRSPDGVLDYVATYFGMHVPIIGQRPPSTTEERIDMREAARGNFVGGARRLEMTDGHTTYTELRVAVQDMKVVVEKMREKVFADGTA